MGFEKGHKGFGSRKKGTPNSKKSKSSLDIYKNLKQWEKSPSRKTLDQAKVDYYIYNNMDLTELYDEMKLYDYTWKEGSDQKKEYMKDYQRKKRNGNEGV